MELGGYTDNYGLLKPDEKDFYEVEDFNENAEIIDKALKALADKGISLEKLINGLAKVAVSGKYEDLSGVPSSLPANGGNADTVDGKHAGDFAPSGFGLGTTCKIVSGSLNDVNNVGFYMFTKANTTDYPETDYTGSWWYLIQLQHNDKYKKQIACAVQNYSGAHFNNKLYTRVLDSGTWGNWELLSDGGNADTVDGKHASEFMLAEKGAIRNRWSVTVMMEESFSGYYYGSFELVGVTDESKCIVNVMPSDVGYTLTGTYTKIKNGVLFVYTTSERAFYCDCEVIELY